MAGSDSGLQRLLPVYLLTLLWVVSWGISVSGPVMPLYIRSLGVGVTGWGMLAMAHAVGMVLFEWFWGALSDRMDRRVFVVVSMLGTSVIFPLYTLRGLIPYFFVLQFLIGALAVILGPVSRALVSDNSPPGSLGMSMSLWEVVMTLGHMIGAVVGSYVAQVRSFEQVFYLSSALSIIGGFAVLITLRRGVERRPRGVGDELSIRKGLRSLISRPSIRFFFCIALTSFMARSVLWAFLPLYASEVVGMTTVEVGMVFAVMSLTQLVAAPIFGRLSYRFGRRRLVIAGFSFTSLMLFLFSFVATPLQLFAAVIGVSVCLSVNPLLLAMLFEATPSRLRGMSMGVYGTFEDMGLMMGPPLYSLIWSVYSPGLAFLSGAAIQSVSLVLILMFRVERRGD